MSVSTAPRRVAGLEHQRTSAALARLRAAWTRYCARPDRPPPDEAARTLSALDALPAAERARMDRGMAALEALVDPATPPAGIARAAAHFAASPGTPTWEVIDAVAAALARLAAMGE